MAKTKAKGQMFRASSERSQDDIHKVLEEAESITPHQEEVAVVVSDESVTPYRVKKKYAPDREVGTYVTEEEYFRLKAVGYADFDQMFEVIKK